MALVFRCDCCWHEEEITYTFEGTGSRLARNCEDCGQDGCAECFTGDLCDECRRLRERADAENIDNAGVGEDEED